MKKWRNKLISLVLTAGLILGSAPLAGVLADPITPEGSAKYGDNYWYPLKGYNPNADGILGVGKVPNGADVYMDLGILPKLAISYTPDSTTASTSAAYDPWKGGKIRTHYEGTVRATNVLLAVSGGLVFAAYITLPPETTSEQVLASLVTTKNVSPVLRVNGQAMDLNQEGLTAVDGHTLRLTFRYKTAESMLGSLGQIILSSGFNADKIPISYDIDVDVSKLTASGNASDTSTSHILTTGKYPAIDSTKLDASGRQSSTPLSVDFYGKDRVKEGKSGDFFQPGNDILYGQPDATGSYVSLRATDYWRGWSQYLSPWDTEQRANNTVDTGETIDGSAANLPGTTNHRTVTLGADETFDPARFIRVADIFTHKNTTAGATVHYTSASDPTQTEAQVKQAGVAAGGNVNVLYYGTDANGIRLSPVTLTIKRATVALPQLTTTHTIQNATLNTAAGTTTEAAAGHTLTATQFFTLASIATGTTLPDAQVKVALPAHTSYVPGSLKINGKAITGTVTTTGLAIPLAANQLTFANAGDKLAITYQYTMDDQAAPATLTAPGATFTSSVQNPNATLPNLGLSAPAATINVIPGGLTLTGPTGIDFGNHTYGELPGTFASTPAAVTVSDTRAPGTSWTLTAQQKVDATLPGTLTLGGKAITATGPTTLYSSADKGTTTLTATQLGDWSWHLSRADVGAQSSLSGDITWTLSSGPAS